ncbi:hypothetical protein AWL63_18520 [Sphingomonas panacis]|uniref:Microcin J25-processing protein McjB C-terminal domain-containing protein n=1 Tax=Sphingomonas panacis TaxID=1560345 RepID=A0A1B3ZDX5_9SPHN|nr:lasso peptide biosynthesis B2 protein [Sphingomonas panacis]AOH85637.1 hypothetical protein AWL63_18520 [Sphingomonas panacis]
MVYRLRQDLFFCVTNGRAVFLDLKADRYFCLPRVIDAVFQSICAGQELTVADQESVKVLLKRDIISEDPLATSPPAPMVIERAEFEPALGSHSRPSALMLARAISAQLTSAVALRTRSFASISQSIATRKRQQDITTLEVELRYAQIIEAFAKTTLLFRPGDRCLPRSLAFFSVCRAYGLEPTLIIGVRINPFVAHCWVQNGTRIVHDDSGEATLFAPILAV